VLLAKHAHVVMQHQPANTSTSNGKHTTGTHH